MRTVFVLLGLVLFAARGHGTDFQPGSHDEQVMAQFIGLLTVYPLRKTTLGDFDPAFAVEKQEGLTWPEAVAEANRRFGERQPRRALFLRRYLNKGSPLSHLWTLDWDRESGSMMTWVNGAPSASVRVLLAWYEPRQPSFDAAFQVTAPKGITSPLDLTNASEPVAWDGSGETFPKGVTASPHWTSPSELARYGLELPMVYTALKMISPEGMTTSLGMTSRDAPWFWCGLGEPMVYTAFKMTSPEGNTTSLGLSSPSEPLLRITAWVNNDQLGSEPVLELFREKQKFKFDASDHLSSITSSLAGDPLGTTVQVSCSADGPYTAQIRGPRGEFEMLSYTPDLLLRDRTVSIPDGEYFNEHFEQGRLRRRVHYGSRKTEHGTTSFVEREETFP